MFMCKLSHICYDKTNVFSCYTPRVIPTTSTKAYYYILLNAYHHNTYVVGVTAVYVLF